MNPPIAGTLRRRALARGLLGLALLAAAPWAAAQDYPSHPVRIIVPFAAGGPADVYARFLAQPGNVMFMATTRKLDPDGLINSFVAGGVVIYAARQLGLHRMPPVPVRVDP